MIKNRKSELKEPFYRKQEPVQAYDGSDPAIRNLLNCVTVEKMYVGPNEKSCVCSPLVSKYFKTFKQPYFLTHVKTSKKEFYVFRNLRLSDFWDSDAQSSSDKTVWVKNLNTMEYGPEATPKLSLMCKKPITDVKLYGYDDSGTMNNITYIMKNKNEDHYESEKILLCRDKNVEISVPINLFSNLRTFVPTKSHIIVEKNQKRYRIDIYVDYNGLNDFMMSFGTATRAQAPHFKKDLARASSCMELLIEKKKMTLFTLNLESSPFYSGLEVLDESDFDKRNSHCAQPLDGSSERFDYKDWADIGRQFALSFGQIYAYKLLDHMSVPYGTFKFKYAIRKNLENLRHANLEIQYLSVSRIKLFLQGTTSYQDSMGVLPVFFEDSKTLHPIAYKAYGKLLKRFKVTSIEDKYKKIIETFLRLEDFTLIKDMYAYLFTTEKTQEARDRVNEYKKKLYDAILPNDELMNELTILYKDNVYLCSTFWWASCRPTKKYLEQNLPPGIYKQIYDDSNRNNLLYAYKDFADTDTEAFKLETIKNKTLDALESFDPMNRYFVTNDLLKVYKPNGLPNIIEWKLN